MTRIDLKRQMPAYRARARLFDVIEVPPLRYLAIDGSGDPNTAPAYEAAVATIFPVACRLSFAARRELGLDYVVMPLEALWWAEDLAAFTTRRDKDQWSWTVLNLVPEGVPDALVDTARDAAADAPAIERLRLLELSEGLCVQTLHIGPYDDEGPLLQRLHEEVIPGRGLRMTGPHHEIYLGDPRRAAPERLRTILRQPVASVTD